MPTIYHELAALHRALGITHRGLATRDRRSDVRGEVSEGAIAATTRHKGREMIDRHIRSASPGRRRAAAGGRGRHEWDAPGKVTYPAIRHATTRAAPGVSPRASQSIGPPGWRGPHHRQRAHGSFGPGAPAVGRAMPCIR